MQLDNIRIADKRNIYIGSPRKPKKATSFSAHLLGENAHYYQGKYFAQGWDASDAACKRAYLDQSAPE